MKLSILGLVFLISNVATTHAQSDEFDTQRFQFDAGIRERDLSCVVPLWKKTPLRKRIFTQLKNPASYFFDKKKDVILMRHDIATTAGCKLKVLDSLVYHSLQRYGFIPAKITVIKKLSHSSRMIQGSCQKNYVEQLEVDLGKGIILLSPPIGMLVAAEHCN